MTERCHCHACMGDDLLRRDINERLMQLESPGGWPRPSRNQYRSMAKENPERLMDWMWSGHLSPGYMTHAAEILGVECNVDSVKVWLMRLLDHPVPMVREGAVLGLSHCLDDYRVVKAIRKTAGCDPSSGVKATAQGVCEDIEHVADTEGIW